MRGQFTRVIGAIALLWIAGCGTAGGSGSGNSSQSNSGNSGSDHSSQSHSGNSNSGDSGSGQSQSGNSQSGNSHSGNSSQSQSGNSASGNSSGDSKSSADSSGSSRSSPGSQSAVLSVTLGGATSVGLGYAIWALASKAPALAVPPPEAVGQAAQAYLRGRTHQLREDLSLGAGPSIEDLAALARIRRDNLRLFGWVLRAHRVELLALTDDATLTPERALLWLARVGELAATQPPLREDRLAFMKAQGLQE